jgi:hypothetical protein
MLYVAGSEETIGNLASNLNFKKKFYDKRSSYHVL